MDFDIEHEKACDVCAITLDDGECEPASISARWAGEDEPEHPGLVADTEGDLRVCYGCLDA